MILTEKQKEYYINCITDAITIVDSLEYTETTHPNYPIRATYVKEIAFKIILKHILSNNVEPNLKQTSTQLNG